MASKIEDYGFIGNGHTSALVSNSGSIDWLCAPTFASDAVFCSLLGYDEHGTWSVRPAQAVTARRQRYRSDTMILETEFDCEGGSVRITDFMPMDTGRCDVVRIVEGLSGEVSVEFLMNVAFGYGANKPMIEPLADGIHFTAGPDSLMLRGPGKFERDELGVSSYLQLKKGERLSFQLTWHASHLATPKAIDVEKELKKTETYWTEWAARCTYEGSRRNLVLRSLLTLKALTYIPTGAIIAAPTTSLPEAIGGVRNWDYRFCWLRDSSLTLDALMIGGYLDEAQSFTDWVLRAAAGAPEDLQIMYDVYGGRRLTEFELPWLPGYEGSKPVHVGNAASGQFQLDVYGELLGALYTAAKLRKGRPAKRDNWKELKRLLAFMERAWQLPDDGIWEVRGGRRHFTHSKVMAWVAIDRGIRAIEELGLGADDGKEILPRLRALRQRIHEEVCARGFHPKLNAFTQSYGGDALDASVLVIPHCGFLPASDPRMVGTVAAIEQRIMRDGFVLRYDPEEAKDGLPGTEGAFLACSFWLCDNYALAGRRDDAEALFEKLSGLCNHLGLLAEEYEPRLQRQVGNFPQGFSHLAMIISAYMLDSLERTGKVWLPAAPESTQATLH